MRYKLLGRSGLRVSELALGTMTFGEAWGWGASAEESRRIFDSYVEAGGNFVDTACNYTDGQSELRRHVRPHRRPSGVRREGGSPSRSRDRCDLAVAATALRRRRQ